LTYFRSILNDATNTQSTYARKQLVNGSDDYLAEARLSMLLVLIEQLVPVLNEKVLEVYVVPLCLPLLNKSSRREIYESAHSVMLSIFGSYADRKQKEFFEFSTSDKHNLVEKLVPFYCGSLLENSEKGKLTTDQLRLAFTNLVRSAKYGAKFRDELAWLCIDQLHKKIKKVDLKRNNGPGSHGERLTLTLISLLSAVSSQILGPLTQILGPLLEEAGDKKCHSSLLEEIKVEIMERVGDADKKFLLDWWGQLAES